MAKRRFGSIVAGAPAISTKIPVSAAWNCSRIRRCLHRRAITPIALPIMRKLIHATWAHSIIVGNRLKIRRRTPPQCWLTRCPKRCAAATAWIRLIRIRSTKFALAAHRAHRAYIQMESIAFIQSIMVQVRISCVRFLISLYACLELCAIFITTHILGEKVSSSAICEWEFY